MAPVRSFSPSSFIASPRYAGMPFFRRLLRFYGLLWRNWCLGYGRIAIKTDNSFRGPRILGEKLASGHGCYRDRFVARRQ